MSDYRPAIERALERAEPRPYSFEIFEDRRRRAARRRRVGAAALGGLLGLIVILPIVATVSDRMGETPALRPISPATVRDLRLYWSHATGASINSTPVVSGDRVYVTSSDGTVLAFPTSCASAPACRPIWSANEGDSTFDIGSPAVGEGMVVVGTAQGKLFGYPTSCGPGTCRATWQADPGGDLSTASPVIADGAVYVGSTDGTLFAYPVRCSSYPRPCSPTWTGRLRGGFGERGYAGAQPVVVDGVVYVGSTGGTLYGFPTSCSSRCEPVREVRLPGVLNNPLVAADGTLYVTSGHFLYAFGTRCLADRPHCGPDWIGRVSSLILSPPAVGDGRVYVGSTDGAVSVFPQACGRRGQVCRPAWMITDLGRSPNPSLLGGVLFVGDSWAVSELQAFDADCGAAGGRCPVLWRYQATDFGSFEQVTASDGSGTLFAVTGTPIGGGGGGPGGWLYAFRVRP